MANFRQTISKPVKTKIVEVRPAPPGTGIVINGIPGSVENVAHCEWRVDYRLGKRMAYLVEHPLASLKIMGIHDAIVEGIEKNWDFTRPEHRAAYARGLNPAAVVGPPDGTPSGGLIEEIEKVGIAKSDVKYDETSIVTEIIHETPAGKIWLSPAPRGFGLKIKIHFDKGSLEGIVDPYQGLISDDQKNKVTKATTPFLVGFSEEGKVHALADVIGDIGGTGRIDNAVIEFWPRGFYHSVTIGAAKKARIVKAGDTL